jgi:hypothetical protein
MPVLCVSNSLEGKAMPELHIGITSLIKGKRG